jgi:hypothetical protein
MGPDMRHVVLIQERLAHFFVSRFSSFIRNISIDDSISPRCHLPHNPLGRPRIHRRCERLGCEIHELPKGFLR